jgi:hypothetical protein
MLACLRNSFWTVATLRELQEAGLELEQRYADTQGGVLVHATSAIAGAFGIFDHGSNRLGILG